MKSATVQKTMVTLLLDKSYSMQAMHEQTIGGINAWLEELKKGDGDTRFSLFQFSSVYKQSADPFAGIRIGLGAVPQLPQAAPTPPLPQQKKLSPGLADSLIGQPRARAMHGGIQNHEMSFVKTYEMVPIADVEPMKFTDFVPEGGTPLIDAAMDTIHAIEASVADRPDIKVVLAIQTDGEENTSVKYSWDDLRRTVSLKEEMGWEIIFMAAGLDAVHQADRMGLNAGKTLAYGVDATSTREAFRTTGEKTRIYASGMAPDMSYSADERMRSGDTRQI